MAKSQKPFFLGGGILGRGSLPDPEVQFESENCNVVRRGDNVEMWCDVTWTKREISLAGRFGVNSLTLEDRSLKKRSTIDFVLDLPPLRQVSISLDTPKDLSSLSKLSGLELLRIHFRAWRLGDHFKPVDLSGLTQLRHADIMMCRAFESVLRCTTVEQLAIGNDCDGKLRDLDLTSMPALRELKLDHCPKLKTVLLHSKARIRALELSLCGSYKIDWKRLGPDLRYLLIGGRLSFPLEDVLHAHQLKELHCHEIRKLPILGFLRDLPSLTGVGLFSASGPKLSDEDHALVQEINSRGATRGRS